MSEAKTTGAAVPTRRFNPYPAYKDSGVEWLGAIPAHWEVRRLKFVVATPLAYGANEAAELTNPELPRYIRITDIRDDGVLRDDTFRSIPEDLAAPYLLSEGDILFARSGATVGKTFRYDPSWGVAAHAGYLIRARVHLQRADSRFVVYFTQSGMYWGWLRSSFIQSTIQNVSAERYASLFLPLPSLGEQRAIVAFLDRETARVDALIAKKERLIELLQEKRAALITRAVTKGLDPSAPMKDSGVEWLRQIPTHWDVKPNGSLFQERDERGRDDLPILEVSIASGVRVREFSETKVEQRSDDLGAYKVARAGDIAFNKMRMWQGAVGTTPEDGLVSPDYIVAKPRTETDPAYYTSLFRTPIYMAEVYRWSHGIVDDRNRLYWDNFKAIRSPSPPSSEQRAIASFLDYETARIDTLIAKVRGAIERLNELRTRSSPPR